MVNTRSASAAFPAERQGASRLLRFAPALRGDPPILFGWVADRIGCVNALALIVLDGAVLCMLLLLQPPFPLLAILVGLIGIHGAGVLPVLGLVLSEAFGRDNFRRLQGALAEKPVTNKLEFANGKDVALADVGVVTGCVEDLHQFEGLKRTVLLQEIKGL